MKKDTTIRLVIIILLVIINGILLGYAILKG